MPTAFEDITSQAGIDFVQQMGGGKLSNILVSDGAGGTFLDFGNDGFVDIQRIQRFVNALALSPNNSDSNTDWAARRN